MQEGLDPGGKIEMKGERDSADFDDRTSFTASHCPLRAPTTSDKRNA